MKVRVTGGCDVWGQERTGESSMDVTNKALDVTKIRIIKRGRRDKPCKQNPVFFFSDPTFPWDG